MPESFKDMASCSEAHPGNEEDGGDSGAPTANDYNSRIDRLESKVNELNHTISEITPNSTKNSTSYIDRLLDYMPTYYVTLVSVIQVIALGLLFASIFEEMSGLSRGTFDPIWSILILAMLLIIISIWITYTRLTSVMRVVPQTMDGIIPFFFGLAEAIPIFCITLHVVAWFYLSLSACAMVAIVQYIHSFRQARLHPELNREFLEKMGSWAPKAILMSVIRFFLWIGFGFVEVFRLLNSLYLAIIFLFLNVVLIIFLHRSLKALAEY
jgi:hypothetical protein